MHRLTRQVRFGISPDGTLADGGTNGFAARPPLLGLGIYLELEATFVGEPDVASQYVKDIKAIDTAVGERVLPVVQAALAAGRSGSADAGGRMLQTAFDRLAGAFADVRLANLKLRLSPQLHLETDGTDMIRLTQTFEFSASHRLHNDRFSDEDNRRMYGKCNNAQGHGHNYVVEVTLKGPPGADGQLMPVRRFEETVQAVVIDDFDHKHLNTQVADFEVTIPSVENIAAAIFQRLASAFEAPVRLDNVRVYETPKTWCDYSA
ncbi:MAG: 6-pyruvoyl tetrahydropterin synthase family protein [Phycisphaerae bacterium]